MGDRLERELKLKDEIRERLKDICSHLSPAEFQELIDQIASNQIKSEYRPFRLGSSGVPDGRLSGPRTPARPRYNA